MVQKIYLFLMTAILLIAASCSESLEDTYKQYAGDGKIRYLGRCSDLMVQPGWERLIVTWKNTDDPVIDKIKLKWSDNNEEKEVLLPRGTTEYSIPDLKNENYEITICSVDKEGNQSLTNTTYSRPYTEEHEEVQAFTRIVSKHFFFKDRLILLFLGWEDTVDEAHITYVKKDGSNGILKLTSDIVNQLYYLLPDEIDASKPVELYRSGYIPGCEDKIVMEPLELDKSKVFNSDFRQEMKRQFGFDDKLSDSWVDSTEEIYLDRSIGNLTDLFNFPNLKKLVLGKHRYIRQEMVDDSERSQSILYDPTVSDFVLRTLHQLNGLTVERYTKQYASLKSASYIIEKGMPALPNLSYMDMKGLKFSSSPQDESNYNSHIEYLTDGNVNSNWETYPSDESVSYIIEIDLKEVKTLQGIKIVQAYYDALNSSKRAMSPSVAKIQVSEDAMNWRSAAYLEDLEIGNSSGETNIIPFVEGGQKAQFVRIQMTTPFYFRDYQMSLAEIAFY